MLPAPKAGQFVELLLLYEAGQFVELLLLYLQHYSLTVGTTCRD